MSRCSSSSTTRPLRILFRTHTSSRPSRPATPWLRSREHRSDLGSSHRSAAALSSPLQAFSSRPYSSTRVLRKSPQTSTPNHEPPAEAPSPPPPSDTTTPTEQQQQPAPLSPETYHDLADSYLDRLVSALEEKAESNAEYEVEYSAGVLSIETPEGTWIINKQPPNKQIWLSSPVTGPKRFDYVGGGSAGGRDGKDDATGARTAAVDADYEDGGRWVYLRDGSGLSELLKGEVGVVVPGEEE